MIAPLRAATGDGPDEGHLLAFNSEQGFAAFRADPALQAAGQLRDAAVRQARVLPLYAVALDEYLAPPDA